MWYTFVHLPIYLSATWPPKDTSQTLGRVLKMAVWTYTDADAMSERRKCRDPSRSFKIQSFPGCCQRMSKAEGRKAL